MIEEGPEASSARRCFLSLPGSCPHPPHLPPAPLPSCTHQIPTTVPRDHSSSNSHPVREKQCNTFSNASRLRTFSAQPLAQAWLGTQALLITVAVVASHTTSSPWSCKRAKKDPPSSSPNSSMSGLMLLLIIAR